MVRLILVPAVRPLDKIHYILYTMPYLGDPEVPFMTDVPIVLIVQLISLVVTVRAFTEHRHKPRVTGTLLITTNNRTLLSLHPSGNKAC